MRPSTFVRHANRESSSQRAERAVARAVEHRLKLILVEQRPKTNMVLRIASDDAFARKRPIIGLTNGNHLPRIALAKIMQRVIARDTGNAGN